jgi:Flp pilus assembly protein TadD
MNYAGNSEFDNAFEEFRISLLCDTNSVDAIGNIGVTYLKTGNKEKARVYFQKALLKDPNNEVFMRDLETMDN